MRGDASISLMGVAAPMRREAPRTLTPRSSSRRVRNSGSVSRIFSAWVTKRSVPPATSGASSEAYGRATFLNMTVLPMPRRRRGASRKWGGRTPRRTSAAMRAGEDGSPAGSRSWQRSASRVMARLIATCPVQRQMLPPSSAIPSASVGAAPPSRKPVRAMTSPGVQYPHWMAPSSIRACCTGLRSAWLRPSMVTTWRSSASPRGRRQELTVR